MTKTSAYSKTAPNCQDSESSFSGQHNVNGLAMQAMKKRKRAALLHSHKKRKDNKIKKRLWALRSLIPNCTQMDKESVLDEAIVYLKCLQLQLQIMPTYAGLCVPPTPITYPLQLYALPLAGLTGYQTRLEMPTPQHHEDLQLKSCLPK